MEEPKTIEYVAKTEKCSVRTVQLWASKNGIKKIGKGLHAPYVFFNKDIRRFRNRNKPGRPWSD